MQKTSGWTVAELLPATVADSQVWAGAGAREACGVEAMSIAQACDSCESAAGPLLADVQSQLDGPRFLQIAQACVSKLLRRMAADGKLVSETAQRHAAADGAAALVAWRNGQTDTEERQAVRVAWRAVVDSISDDTLGESVPLGGTAEDDWLFPSPTESESRAELANRLLVQRAASRRSVALGKRVEFLAGQGGRGKRREALAKLERACQSLLAGLSLEQAAQDAGFTASGRTSAASRLRQAVRRVAPGWQVFHPNKR